MSAPRLREAAVTLIQDAIKKNIASELALVREDRDDAKVVLQIPQSYFIYREAKGYKTPAVFIISTQPMDFKTSEHQANFIDAVVPINIYVVLEDREKTLLTYKAWRFESAIHSILAQTQLTSTDNRVKLTVVVKRTSFSDEYKENNSETESVFRKEVLLECDVYHRENY